jgi:hypothetical protein
MFFVITCDDSVNPNADFRERNILNGIINADTNDFVVTLSRSYEIDGLDPYENTTDPAIHGADVKVWFDDKVRLLVEDTVGRIDKSRYDSDVSFYFNDDVQPLPGSFIEIEALLQSGLLLKSRTQVPDTLKTSAFINSDKIVPATSYSDEFFISWTNESGIFYHPRLFIRYYYNKSDSTILLKKQIPFDYVSDGDSLKPVYANPSLKSSYSISMETLDRAMEDISGDDPEKGDYFIVRIELEVMIYNKELSTYYSSVSNFSSDFTILVNQPDYTNIEGGFGVFGAYGISKFKINLTDDYIESFGYTKIF